MILEVHFPSVVRHVPPRARVERTELVRTKGTFAIPTAHRDAFEPLPAIGDGPEAFLHDGQAWVLAAERRPGTSDPPAWFVDLLRSVRSRAGPDIVRQEILLGILSGTPLLARGDPEARFAREDKPTTSRGAGIDPAASRSVTHDGREAARAAVAAHLARDWRVVDGTVFRRRPPLATCAFAMPSRVWTRAGMPAIRGDGELCAGPDTYAAMMAIARRRHVGSTDGPDAGSWLASGHPASEGEEHRIFANAQPGHLRRQIEGEIATCATPDTRDALEAHRREMAAMEWRSLTGTCGDDDLPGALARIRAAAVARWESRETASRAKGFAMPCELVERLDELYIPTCPAPPLAEADAAQLAMLSP